MSRLGYGYGSEWHLLRYLGYRREALNKRVVERVGGDHVSWLDFPFNCGRPLLDDEWKGLSFLGREHGGRPQIRRLIEETEKDLGIVRAGDWLTPYYQYANRLAVLAFLLRHGVGARLVFLYFIGDTNPYGDCPKSEDGWLVELAKVRRHLGLAGTSPVEQRVHEVFVPTCERGNGG